MRFILLSVFVLGVGVLVAGDPPTGVPPGIRNQPFGVQWHWLDTFLYKSRKEAEWMDGVRAYLDSREGQTGDPAFDQVIQLEQFRRRIQGDSISPDLFDELHAWVDQQVGQDRLAIQAVRFQLLAEYFWDRREYSSGLENYIRAYDLYRDMDPRRFPLKSQFLYDYASQYYYFRDFQTVKDLLLEMWQTIPEDYVDNQVTSLNTLGLCYGQLAQYDSSSYYYQKALHLVARQSEQVWKGIVKGNLAMNLIQQGKFDEAVPLLEENIASSRQRGAMSDLAFSLIGLGEIRLKQDRPREALDLIQEGHDILVSKKKLSNYIYQARVYVPLGKALFANGRTAEAFIFLDAGREARDSVEAQRNALFLSGVQHKLETEQHLAALTLKETKLKEQRMLMFILGFVLLGSAIFTVVFFRQKNKIAAEKKRSDHLLLNILPEEVAADLKQYGKVAARHYAEVTILFTDFKDFTRIAESMSADDLVEVLDDYFRKFDEITSRFNLEKIKTIGDAYMAASGLPAESDDHAQRAVSAALALRDMVQEEERVRKEAGRPYFQLRIGLHSGPVVAGVIGLNKFSYDIWGDTVNLAARMESSGEVGQVNISADTHALVHDKFRCTYRGEIPAKNKGEIGMYFVDSGK